MHLLMTRRCGELAGGFAVGFGGRAMKMVGSRITANLGSKGRCFVDDRYKEEWEVEGFSGCD